jgi:aminoglycoside phosphotransferase family enzyme/predicted kinase
MTELNLTRQQQLIDALVPVLEKQFNKPVERIETHISTLLLVGAQAFKIKKPVDFGFLNFTKLQQRKFYCEEELRLNRRLAPEIYEQVVAISGENDHPKINDSQPVIEYMVKMKRFEQHELFDQKLKNNTLTEEHVIELAKIMADFHQHIDIANGRHGIPVVDNIIHATTQNFDQLRSFMQQQNSVLQQRFSKLELWSKQNISALSPLFRQRLEDGFVRECHGDMHLGNITLYQGQVTVFDGIEFNAGFRWIDVMSEIAFITMDLDSAGQTTFSSILLNHYLEQSGDYAGLQLLPYYQVYRAMVRAKVTALRLGQLQDKETEYQQQFSILKHYLEIAYQYTKKETPKLLITQGVSGTGKTFVSQQLLKHFAFIRIRSDVERKRLYPIAQQRYTAGATRKTYDYLHELAAGILQAGYSVIIDATYLEHQYRHKAFILTRASHYPFLIISLQMPVDILEQRITQRIAKDNDASEATIEVLHKQLAKAEALTTDEMQHMLVISSNDDILEKITTKVENLK